MHGPNEGAFGHMGAGGQIGFADPTAHVACGFVRNHLENQALPLMGACLVDMLYSCLGAADRGGAGVRALSTHDSTWTRRPSLSGAIGTHADLRRVRSGSESGGPHAARNRPAQGRPHGDLHGEPPGDAGGRGGGRAHGHLLHAWPICTCRPRKSRTSSTTPGPGSSSHRPPRPRLPHNCRPSAPTSTASSWSTRPTATAWSTATSRGPTRSAANRRITSPMSRWAPP